MRINLDASDLEFLAAGEVIERECDDAGYLFRLAGGGVLVLKCDKGEVHLPFVGTSEVRLDLVGFSSLAVMADVPSCVSVQVGAGVERSEWSDPTVLVEPHLNQLMVREDPQMAAVMKELMALRAQVGGTPQAAYTPPVSDDGFGDGHMFQEDDDAEDDDAQAAPDAAPGKPPAPGDAAPGGDGGA